MLVDDRITWLSLGGDYGPPDAKLEDICGFRFKFVGDLYMVRN